jgi:hypothetical protein
MMRRRRGASRRHCAGVCAERAATSVRCHRVRDSAIGISLSSPINSSAKLCRRRGFLSVARRMTSAARARSSGLGLKRQVTRTPARRGQKQQRLLASLGQRPAGMGEKFNTGEHFYIRIVCGEQERSRMKIRTLVLWTAVGFLVTLTGCSVYPEKKTPTLATTTSAEQSERLYWKAVAKGEWQQVMGLQGPGVLFTTRNGDHVTGEQWVEWLKQNPPAEYLIGAVQLRPQGADMVVSYVASVVSQAKSASPAEMAVVSVWQQVGNNLILVAHSETPRRLAAK